MIGMIGGSVFDNTGSIGGGPELIFETTVSLARDDSVYEPTGVTDPDASLLTTVSFPNGAPSRTGTINAGSFVEHRLTWADFESPSQWAINLVNNGGEQGTEWDLTGRVFRLL